MQGGQGTPDLRMQGSPGVLFAVGPVDQGGPPAEEVGAAPMRCDQKEIVASPLRYIGCRLFIRCELKQAGMFIGSDGHANRLSRVLSFVEVLAMPSRPPSLKQKPRAKAWASTHKSRHERGYGREHDRMRAIVLREEPLCRPCQARGRITPSTTADHIKPLSEGGTGERENYQGICKPCHDTKTAEEAARARGARPPRQRLDIGADGWPK